MIDWSVWLKETLAAHQPLTDVFPVGSHFAGGSLDKAPSERPFLVIQIGVELFNGKQISSTTEGLIYIHDEPGTYMTINQGLRLVKSAIESAPRVPDMTEATWRSNSGNLSDDKFSTIVRYGTFALVGRTS